MQGAALTPDLDFSVESAAPLKYSAAPHIAFKLRVSNAGAQSVHSVLLQCQIQLDVARRQYTADDQQRLVELFGEPEQWRRTLHTLLWTNLTAIVPAFSGNTVIDVHMPCTFDFTVATTKYLAGVEDGEIPLSFFFSGTVFYDGGDAGLQVAPVSWDKEASYRLPISVWQNLMDVHYPNTTWLCLTRDAFDRLNSYKVRNGLPTFEAAIEAVIR